MVNKKHVPELDNQHCPSSTNEKEQTNKLLLWDILVPSPDILTFTFFTGPVYLYAYNKKGLKGLQDVPAIII